MTECKDEHILNSIDYPEDLRKLSPDKLGEVCAELRQYIIDVLSENPGHLGASLGTVELTVALHYVFNTPYDRIVWDVGHQAYGHKILTGRREAFHTLRKFKESVDFLILWKALMTHLLPDMLQIPFRRLWVCRSLLL